jgi:hypothetical protein
MFKVIGKFSRHFFEKKISAKKLFTENQERATAAGAGNGAATAPDNAVFCEK